MAYGCHATSRMGIVKGPHSKYIQLLVALVISMFSLKYNKISLNYWYTELLEVCYFTSFARNFCVISKIAVLLW